MPTSRLKKTPTVAPFRESRAYGVWTQIYNRCWGGVKNLILPNEQRVYRVLRGPGRGIRILTNPVHGGTRVLLGAYEPRLMRWMATVIQPGDVVFDIGSADGHEALIAAKLAGPSGRVYAFEPDDRARAELCANLARNPELAGRIQVLPYFVGTEHDPARGIVSIDGLCSSRNVPPLPAPRVVKVDVDGPEHEVLTGMRELASRACPQTFVECHVSPAVEDAVRTFFAHLNIPTRRADPSLFEVSRRGYNTWVWTETPR